MGSGIYTRTGDAGTTALLDGTRVPKHAPRIEALGAVDEICSWLGAARAFCEDRLLLDVLEFAGQRLYNCSSVAVSPAGGTVAAPPISVADVEFVERAIDRFEERTGALAAFVLPGGNRAAGLLHVARAVCRRAERRLWSLAEREEVDEVVLVFLNRCSDLLFAAARYANAVAGKGDARWDPERPIPEI